MTIANLITSLRTLAHDKLTDKAIFGEQLGGSDQLAFPVNGSNTVFRLKQIPLADAAGTAGAALYVWVTIVGTGAVTRTHNGFAITDPLNGIITFTAAPNPGSSNNAGVYVDYNYVWFTDTVYTEWLNQAANDTYAGVTDATQIPEGLIEAMLQYALYYFYMNRATQYAERYESSGGDAGEQVQTVTQAFTALAKAAKASGDAKRKDYYQRQGQRDLPSSQDGNVTFDPITPIR